MFTDDIISELQHGTSLYPDLTQQSALVSPHGGKTRPWGLQLAPRAGLVISEVGWSAEKREMIF